MRFSVSLQMVHLYPRNQSEQQSQQKVQLNSKDLLFSNFHWHLLLLLRVLLVRLPEQHDPHPPLLIHDSTPADDQLRLYLTKLQTWILECQVTYSALLKALWSPHELFQRCFYQLLIELLLRLRLRLPFLITLF